MKKTWWSGIYVECEYLWRCPYQAILGQHRNPLWLYILIAIAVSVSTTLFAVFMGLA